MHLVAPSVEEERTDGELGDDFLEYLARRLGVDRTRASAELSSWLAETYLGLRCQPARPSMMPPSALSATTMPASAMMLTSGALNAESVQTARQR